MDARKTDLPIIYTASHFDYGFERVYIPPEPGLKGFYDRVRQDIQAFGENCLSLCKKDAEAGQVPMTPVLREGLPSGILTEEARSGDLLVIGQKGENAHIERAIVGVHDGGRGALQPPARSRLPARFQAPRACSFPMTEAPSRRVRCSFSSTRSAASGRRWRCSP